VSLVLGISAARASVRARLFVGAACTDWQLDPLRDDGMLVSSELVANAVLHARTECRLTVQLDARGLTIAVHDHRPGWIKRRPSIDPTNLRGLGFFVVDRLTRSWGTTPTADGKKVWALLPMPVPPTERRNE
jgi:anti-sigma regulatory factor (Ser/Thr protein kinase)